MVAAVWWLWVAAEQERGEGKEMSELVMKMKMK